LHPENKHFCIQNGVYFIATPCRNAAVIFYNTNLSYCFYSFYKPYLVVKSCHDGCRISTNIASIIVFKTATAYSEDTASKGAWQWQ
jgi:hypothetical protein